ncbi:FG-GAP-like repeat-containing protein [Dawidia soli]|uniref:VCBS repeat-containing protein n=1 Tax=Dawidia soli TaxID=2782352 RepID=A0AAP2DAJ5_9BACT|nr:FG-GAP-like repeat-containing protein [Dawidia soli]MBT1688441.1 VCBS repeat-containing protein [Dawidia soli]
MKQALAPTVKTTLLAGFFLLLVTVSWGQRPVIQGIEQVSGSTGQLILIKGNSFGGDKTKLLVHFGAVQGTVESATDQTLKVRVPAGTTYSHLTVTNLTSHLTAYSPNPFLLSFSGEHPTTVASFDARQDYSADKGVDDLCLCDLNNDGLSEVITTHSGVSTLSVYQNNSTAGAGTVALNRIVLPGPGFSTLSLHVKCDDLNGDGWKDVVVTGTGNASAAEKVYVLQNANGSTFTVIPITVPGWAMADVEINDIDLDGRPDLVISNRTENNTLGILRNTSTGTALSFNEAPVVLVAAPDVVGGVSTFKGTNALAVQDVNGDGRPEIMVSQLQEPNHNNLWIFPNQSTSGTISFGSVTKYSIDGRTVQSMRVGDLDGDGKADIAFNSLSGGTYLARNTSSSSTFSFASPVGINSEVGREGMDFGDVDGDGKIDIVMGCNQFNRALTILNNNSTPGSLSFTGIPVTTPLVSKYVRVGDMDGDGKPDIVFPGADVTAPQLSILRNKSCVMPKIDPKEDFSLCTGVGADTLTATWSPGAFYEWKKGGVTVACGKDQYRYRINATVANSGAYTVTIRTEGGASCTAGSCALSSESVNVTISTESAVTLNPSNNGPVCKNTEITLSAGGSTSGVSYSWTGPNGYAQTTTSNSPPPFLATGVAQAGEYTVEATKGGCVAGKGRTLVEVIEIPSTSFKISGPAAVVACIDDPNFTLQLDEAPMAFTYKWFKEGNVVSIGSGAVSPPIVTETSTNGNYYVEASSTGCGSFKTPSVKVTITTKPVVEIIIPAKACTDQVVAFKDNSTLDPNATPVYEWSFDVGNPSAGSTKKDPETSYSSPGVRTVQLSIHYGNNACKATSAPKTIDVTLSPVASIVTPDNVFEFCEGTTLPLEVSSTASISSYTWSTGETTPLIEAADGGTYTVDIAFADVPGCVATKSQAVAQLEAPEVIVTGTPERINEGETSQLTASGLDTYQWTPFESLSDATVPNPVAQPVTTTEYTVTGTGANGCPGSGTFILQVVGEAIVTKLNPHNFFSPNNDGPNEQWQVDEILNYAQCGVVIYDDKGVKVFEAKPYHNDWNGTFNGKQLPDGVYFYIIRCDGEESTPRAGSITLLR